MAELYHLHSSGQLLVATASPVLEQPTILSPRLGMILPTHVVEERAQEEFERRQAYTGLGPNLHEIERMVFGFLDGPRDPNLLLRDGLLLIGLSIAAVWAYPEHRKGRGEFELEDHVESDIRGIARVVLAVPELAIEVGIGPPASVQGEGLLDWVHDRLARWRDEVQALPSTSSRRIAVNGQFEELSKLRRTSFKGKQCVDTLTGVVGRNVGEDDDAQGEMIQGELAPASRGGLRGRERVDYLKGWVAFLGEQVDAGGQLPIRYGADGLELDGDVLGQVFEEAVGRGRPTVDARLDPDAEKERRAAMADETVSTPDWVLQVRETQDHLEDLPLMRGLLQGLSKRGRALPAPQRDTVLETLRVLESNREDREFLAAFAHRSGHRRVDAAAAYGISEGALRGALPRVDAALRRAGGRVE